MLFVLTRIKLLYIMVRVKSQKSRILLVIVVKNISRFLIVAMSRATAIYLTICTCRIVI